MYQPNLTRPSLDAFQQLDKCRPLSQQSKIRYQCGKFGAGLGYTITKAYGLLKNMQFDDDPCAIKNYIKKRLSNFDLETIINSTNLTIDPTSCALLQKAQSTSAAVERSFSMLSKLLRKDRNFDVKNIKKYMMLYYNYTVWLSLKAS